MIFYFQFIIVMLQGRSTTLLCRRGSVQAQAGLEHRVLFKFSRLSLRSPKSKPEKSPNLFSYEPGISKNDKEENPYKGINSYQEHLMPDTQNLTNAVEFKRTLFRRSQSQKRNPNSKSRIDQVEGSFGYNNMSQSTNHTNLLDVEGSTLRRCRSEKRNTNYNFENNKIQESLLGSLSQTPSYPKPTVNVERLSPKKVCNEENMFSKFHRLSLRNPKASNSEPTTPTKRLILEPVPLK